MKFAFVMFLVLLGSVFLTPISSADDSKPRSPLVIGESFTIDSKILKETRRINVYLPPDYANSADARLPVLYMPDGGMAEDFLHIAGLVQVSTGNGTMRPHILVGIENTQRRRDLTSPPEVEAERKTVPNAGGASAFRKFLRDELKPEVQSRYRITTESAIIGESLAGLFVVETLLVEPELFDTYIAIDPSVWWNKQKLAKSAGDLLKPHAKIKKSLFLATSEEKETEKIVQQLADDLRRDFTAQIRLHYEAMPEEKHSTIFHPAALKAFRHLLLPAPR